MAWNKSNPAGGQKIRLSDEEIRANWAAIESYLALLSRFPTATDGFLAKGLVQRPKFTWKDADEVYIGAGAYQHEGTKKQIVYWDSQLTYPFGALAASDWSYLYLDDSAIDAAGTNLLTASEFIDSTTEPTWNDAKHGWYNGADKCILGVLTDGGSNILEFFHDGDLVVLGEDIEDRAPAALSNVWTDVTLTLPSYCTKAMVTFSAVNDGGVAIGYWRTNGATDSGHRIYTENTVITYANNTLNVITDGDQKIEVKHHAAGTEQMGIYTDGWYFPVGM